MAHPHVAMFITGAAQPPSLSEVLLSESSPGGEDEFGACTLPHEEEIAFTVLNGGQSGYTITTQIREAVGGNPAGAYANVETGLAASSGSSFYQQTNPINNGGTEDHRWQARVRIIRTSDSAVISELESSVHQITTMGSCIE